MTRMCTVCWKPPREGDEMGRFRVRTEEDMEATGINEVSLRVACSECADAHRQRMATALGVDPKEITKNQMC